MSDLDVTIRVAAPPTFGVEREAVERLRTAVQSRRTTRAEFVARLAREASIHVAFAMPMDSLRRQEIA